MTRRKSMKLIVEGDFAAQVPVELVEDGHDWGPYLSLEDAAKLDSVRKALRTRDLGAAEKLGRIFQLIGINSPTENYLLFRNAILERRQITCTYEGRYRELCPVIIGHTRGQERVLAFQFGGESASGLPAGGEWKCLDLSKVIDAASREGPWHEGASHTKAQTCVRHVDIDANIPVGTASRPGRSAA